MHRRPLLLAWAAVVAACAAPGAADTGEPLPACARCALGDASNFSYDAALSLARFPLPVQQDAVLDWTALGADLRGWPLDGAPGQARLVAFGELGPDAVAEGLAAGTLAQDEVALFGTCETEDATCALSEFLLGYAELDVPAHFNDDLASWLLLLGDVGSSDIASAAFLVPDAGADPAEARFTDGCSTLSAEVDLHSLAPVRVSAGAELEFDWSALTLDGVGNALDPRDIDSLSVGHFAGRSVADLEPDGLLLDELATTRWTLAVDDQLSSSLAGLDGPTSFQGVDTDGTWLLELSCSRCTWPGPRFVTVLLPET